MSKNSGVKGLVIILVVAVLLAGGWFVYKAYKADPAVEEISRSRPAGRWPGCFNG